MGLNLNILVFFRDTIFEVIIMVYRMVSRFANTEKAQSAAYRINEKIPGIYEIRLHYRSDLLESGVTNNIVYSQTSNAIFPYSLTPDDPPMVNWREGMMGRPNIEISDECYLTVLVEEEHVPTVQQIAINEGGFDIKSFSSKLY